MDELKVISDAWLTGKRVRELPVTLEDLADPRPDQAALEELFVLGVERDRAFEVGHERLRGARVADRLLAALAVRGGLASDLVGGATTFLRPGKRRLEVNPKAGSVLIFQHDGLLHEGSVVDAGTKFTVRTDILYEWVRDEDNE